MGREKSGSRLWGVESREPSVRPRRGAKGAPDAGATSTVLVIDWFRKTSTFRKEKCSFDELRDMSISAWEYNPIIIGNEWLCHELCRFFGMERAEKTV